MPAVFGLLLFPYVPFRKAAVIRGTSVSGLLVGLLAVGASLTNFAMAATGEFESGVNTTRMTAVQELIDRMAVEYESPTPKVVRYVLPMVGDMSPCAFQNVLRYEYNATMAAGGLRSRAGTTFTFPEEAAFTASDTFLWDRALPGLSEPQRMSILVDTANAQTDFLVLPTEVAMDFLRKERPHYLLNSRIRDFSDRVLASGQWHQIGKPVQFDKGEQYNLYLRDAN
jgi:hypothetical protein